MRFAGFRLCLAAVLAVMIPHAAARANSPDAEAPPHSRSNWIAAALPAVVSILTAKFVGDPEHGMALRRINGYGSGFIVDPGGVIVTNRHVVEGMSDVIVTFHDQRRVRARPIYVGEGIDLALLRVEAHSPLPTLTFGDSDKVEVGDEVAAVGNPLELGGSVSSGIVSGLNRDIHSGPYDDFIQTDAAINHGNSGGPLIDTLGQVIGVNTAIYSPSDTSGSIGIGFAAPSNDVRFVVEEVLRYGRIRAGWLGLDAQTMKPAIAEAIGAPQLRGSIIAHIQKDAPALVAGLRVGDVVTKVGNRTPQDSRALARAVAETPPGGTVAITVWRDGQELTIPVKLGEWQDHPMMGKPNPGQQVAVVREDMQNFGLKLARIGDDVRRKLALDPGQKGAAVASVALNSPATDVGLQAGDVILAVQMKPVDGPEQAQRLLDEAREQKTRYVLLLVQRPNGYHYLPMPGFGDQL